MLMPGRRFTTSTYRYGFNGQETSIEISANSFVAPFWEYDSKNCRRWNVDSKQITGVSPYSTFANNPIINIDPLGDTSITTPGGTTTEIPSYAVLGKVGLAGNVTGTTTPASSVSNGVESFTIGSKVFTARYNSSTGEFTRYLDQGLNEYKESDYFDIQINSVGFWGRVGGFLQGTGGILECVGGAAAIGASDGFATIPGYLLAAKGVDDFSTGFTTCFTGNYTLTYTERALQSTGLSPESAFLLNGYISAGLSGGCAPGGLFRGSAPLITNSNASNLIVKSESQIASSEQRFTIQFGKDDNQIFHAFRHTDELGLDRALVKSAIERHFASVSSKIVDGKPFNQIIEIAGVKIQYTAYKISESLINIGRIHGIN